MKAWRGIAEQGGSWELAKFSANELATIAGIPLPLQRAWRARGQLPGGSGKRASFDSLEVAEIQVRYLLSLNGIAPSESGEIGAAAARLVLLFSLLNHDGACEVRGDQAAQSDFLSAFEASDAIASEIAGSPEQFAYLWRGDGGAASLVPDIAQIVEDGGYVAHFFLDLIAAGSQLAERAERPLVSVSLPSEGSTKSTRRLTQGRRARTAK